MSKNRTILAVLASIVIILIVVLATRGDAQATEPTPTPEPCVPSPAIPEVPGTPEVPAVTHEEQVFDYWQRYSWTGGPHREDDPPAFPSEDWQPNVKGDPHGVGVEGAYFRSHGNSGNGDWFYLEAVMKTVVVVDSPAIPATPGTPGTPEVVCPETPTETPTPTPTETPTTTTPVPTETPTVTPTVPTETPATPETPVVVTEDENDDISEDDPVVTVETSNTPTKTIKVFTHESGLVTKTVKSYGPASELVEEGL